MTLFEEFCRATLFNLIQTLAIFFVAKAAFIVLDSGVSRLHMSKSMQACCRKWLHPAGDGWYRSVSHRRTEQRTLKQLSLSLCDEPQQRYASWHSSQPS
jgi:hypothetical protein